MLPSHANEQASIEEPARLTVWEGLKQRASVIAIIAIFLLALLALQNLLRDFHYHEVIAQLNALSGRQLLIALLFTALSYWTLTGYDLSALNYVGIKLPYKLIAFAAFTGYAVSNNLGFMLLSGGSIRFRLYSAAGVSAGDIAKIVVFAGATFTIGIMRGCQPGVSCGPQRARALGPYSTSRRLGHRRHCARGDPCVDPYGGDQSPTDIDLAATHSVALGVHGRGADGDFRRRYHAGRGGALRRAAAAAGG